MSIQKSKTHRALNRMRNEGRSVAGSCSDHTEGQSDSTVRLCRHVRGAIVLASIWISHMPRALTPAQNLKKRCRTQTTRNTSNVHFVERLQHNEITTPMHFDPKDVKTF